MAVDFARQLDAYRVLRARWRDDPGRYARERLGMRPTWQQQQILELIAPEGAHVSVRSGHGTGKSSATAAAIWWFLECRDYAKIPCTAPSAHQLRDVLWAELSKWRRNSDKLSRARGDHKRLWLSRLFRWGRDRVYDRASPEEWFAVARTSGRDNPDALQGFHASDIEISEDGQRALETGAEGSILFVLDEASGVYEPVFEVAEGALSSPGARLLMLANPTRLTGYFADSHRGKRGDFATLHLRSGDSPLVDPEYRARLVRRYGEGSNVVRVRADGEFPRQEDDALIALEHAEAAITRDPGPRRGEIRVGVDVARFGDDRTVYAVRQGLNLLHLESSEKRDTMQVAGRAKQLRRQFRASGILVDETGVGAGVVDRLREQGEPVTGVVVGESAPNRGWTDQDAQGRTLRDFLWLEMQRWCHDEEPSFSLVDRQMADDLAGELASVHFTLDSSGRVIVESKDSLKKRGLRSPDIADAVGVTFAPERKSYHPTRLNL